MRGDPDLGEILSRDAGILIRHEEAPAVELRQLTALVTVAEVGSVTKAAKQSVVLGMQRGSRVPAPVDAVATTLAGLTRDLVRAGAWPSARLATFNGTS